MVNLLFWPLSFALLLSWELVLFYPLRFFYWLILCLLCATFMSWFLVKNQENTKTSVLSQIGFIFLCVGVFWWFLWLDFVFLKFIIPILVFGLLIYSIKESASIGRMRKEAKLAIFLGGTFFWAAVSYGLMTVLGWKLWQVFLIFMFSFAIVSVQGIRAIGGSFSDQARAWLLLVFLGSELFSTIAWLPFTESTLALICTILVLLAYDLEKYLIIPSIIRKRIIIRKIFLYSFFLFFVLISTPWS